MTYNSGSKGYPWLSPTITSHFSDKCLPTFIFSSLILHRLITAQTNASAIPLFLIAHSTTSALCCFWLTYKAHAQLLLPNKAFLLYPPWHEDCITWTFTMHKTELRIIYREKFSQFFLMYLRNNFKCMILTSLYMPQFIISPFSLKTVIVTLVALFAGIPIPSSILRLNSINTRIPTSPLHLQFDPILQCTHTYKAEVKRWRYMPSKPTTSHVCHGQTCLFYLHTLRHHAVLIAKLAMDVMVIDIGRIAERIMRRRWYQEVWYYSQVSIKDKLKAAVIIFRVNGDLWWWWWSILKYIARQMISMD